jgi:copper chaperone
MNATYRVEGMTCGHCVRAVEEALGTVEGVVGVSVDREKGEVVVRWASDARAQDAVVAERMEEEGFTFHGRAGAI